MWRYWKGIFRVFWGDFRTSTGEQMIGALLVIGILICQIHYGIIKAGEIHANFLAIGWPYFILIIIFLAFHFIRAPYKLDEQKTSVIANNQKIIQSKEAEILVLTWPPDRPQISFHSWGQMQPQFAPPFVNDLNSYMFQNGFYLSNDGGPALEIEIEDFQIGASHSAFGRTISRIGSKAQGFMPILIRDAMPMSRYALNVALVQAREAKININELAWSSPLTIPLCVAYRDFGNVRYRTHCELHFVHKPGQIDGQSITFTAPRQERASHAAVSS